MTDPILEARLEEVVGAAIYSDDRRTWLDPDDAAEMIDDVIKALEREGILS